MKFIFALLVFMSVSCKSDKRYHDHTGQEITITDDSLKLITEIKLFQQELNQEFKNPESSPLTEQDRKSFQGLDFFPIDPKYHILARFERTMNEKPFLMPTTTERKSEEVKYGIAFFQIDGVEYQLNIYQNLKLMLTDKYKDYLFLPFSDRTNGASSYGGGRYIDLTIVKGDSILIDFNKAYNPYCAYNKKYSCPLVPAENNLDTEITAGVKKFK